MKKEKIKRISCLFIIGIDLLGLLSAFDIFNGNFYFDRFKTFTVIAAINIFLYYLLDYIHLRHSPSFFIPGWKYSAFIDMTIISLYGLIYLWPAYGSDQSLKTSVFLLWIVLPLLLILDWMINEKKHMHYRFILIGMFLPVVYIVLALILGSVGYGFGLNGSQWPYPFLNVDQLGWQLVIESCILRILFWIIYSWLVVRIDRAFGRKKKNSSTFYYSKKRRRKTDWKVLRKPLFYR